MHTSVAFSLSPVGPTKPLQGVRIVLNEHKTIYAQIAVTLEQFSAKGPEPKFVMHLTRSEAPRIGAALTAAADTDPGDEYLRFVSTP